MTLEYYSILTDIGLQKQLECMTSPEDFDLYSIAVGDGNGTYYEPTKTQTSLKNEKWRGVVSEFSKKDNKTYCVVHIPANIGGFTIREIGVFDSAGKLIVIGKCPETIKQSAETGAIKQLAIEVDISMINSTILSVLVDPSIITASTSYVQSKINEILNNNLPDYQLNNEKGQSNGYAPLNAKSLVPSEHLPTNLTPFCFNSGNTTNGIADVIDAPGSGTIWSIWDQPTLTSNTSNGVVTGTGSPSPSGSYFNAFDRNNNTLIAWGSTAQYVQWQFDSPKRITTISTYGYNQQDYNATACYKVYSVDGAGGETLLGTTVFTSPVVWPAGYYYTGLTLSSEVEVSRLRLYPTTTGGYGGSNLIQCDIGATTLTSVSTAANIYLKAGGNYLALMGTNPLKQQLTINSPLSLNVSSYVEGLYYLYANMQGYLESIGIAQAGKDLFVDFSLGNANDNYSLHTSTLIGAPTFTNNKFNSNGATGLTYPIYNLGTGAWCIIKQIKSTNTTTRQAYIDLITGSTANALYLGKTTANKLELYLSSSSSSINIANGTGSALGSKSDWAVGTDYYIMARFLTASEITRLGLTGSPRYEVCWSTDYNPLTGVGTWTVDITVVSSVSIYASTNPIRFAISGASVNPLIGTIDNIQLTVGAAVPILKNKVMIQKSIPLYPINGDIWVDTSTLYKVKNYNNGWIDETRIPIGSVSVANGLVQSYSCNPYNQNGYNINSNTVQKFNNQNISQIGIITANGKDYPLLKQFGSVSIGSGASTAVVNFQYSFPNAFKSVVALKTTDGYPFYYSNPTQSSITFTNASSASSAGTILYEVMGY